MKKTQLLIALSALLLFFSSCNKDDAEPTTKADLLANRVWQLEAHTVNPGLTTGNGQIVTDIYQYYGSTYQDDLIKFNRNPNTYTFEEGTTKSDQTGDQVYDAGTWTLNSDETVLVLQSANGQTSSEGQIILFEGVEYIVSGGTTTHLTNYTIEELTADRFSYSFSFRLGQSTQIYKQTFTYRPQ